MGSEKEHEKRFDISSKTMAGTIVIIIFVVMLLVFLHLYARYLMRRQERRRRATLLHQAMRQIGDDQAANSSEPQTKLGLDPLVISSLPSFSYSQTNLGHGETVECSVCLGTVVEDDMVRVLPNCKHIFHVECIDMWLGSHTTCPVCRSEAEPRVQFQESVQVQTQIQAQAQAQPPVPPIEGQVLEKPSGSGSGSGSRLNSFRMMLSRGRSGTTTSCGGEINLEDLERQ